MRWMEGKPSTNERSINLENSPTIVLKMKYRLATWPSDSLLVPTSLAHSLSPSMRKIMLREKPQSFFSDSMQDVHIKRDDRSG